MHACRRQRSGGGRFVTKPEDQIGGPTTANDGTTIDLTNQNRSEG